MRKSKNHPWVRDYEETETGRQSDMTAAREEAGTSPFNPPSPGTKIEPARRPPPRSTEIPIIIRSFELALLREGYKDEITISIQGCRDLLAELRLAEAELERARAIWRPGTLRG